MSDLFRKLNVLVKAAVNDALGDEQGRKRPSSLSPQKLGGDIDREVKMLRQRINDALEYETELQKRVQSLRDSVAQWDTQADDAVSAGQDAQARYAVEQMQRTQRSLDMAESDLRDHQLVTQELISRVNTLDAAVADANRAKAEQETDEAVAPTGQVLSDALKDVREKISRVADDLRSAQTQTLETPEPEASASEAVDPQEVDDDLAERLQRLSKPEK